MDTNPLKLLGYLSIFTLGLGGFTAAYSPSHAVKLGLSQIDARPGVPRKPHGEADIQAQIDRNLRRGRSPAFVAGSDSDRDTRASVEGLLAAEKVAAVNLKLKTYFGDDVPAHYWIRANLAIGAVEPEREVSPREIAAIGEVYAKILGGEEASLAALSRALEVIPRTEVNLRRPIFRILSDLGLRNPSLRTEVKRAILADATRAGSHPEAALAFTSMLRMGSTREWYREIRDAYRDLHPGSELSDFVSLNVANL